jgi:alkylation response protein AidB-like acyl-CoA dehydrogenase
MDILAQAAVADVSDRLLQNLDWLATEADRLDQEAAFPADIVPALHAARLLTAPLPVDMGGSGLGTEPAAADMTCRVLRDMGRLWLPLGRIFEGHVNAVRLGLIYGTTAQARRIAADAHAGHLFAIWAAENPADPLRINSGKLAGRKSFASGTGAVTRALVTVRHDGGEQMVLTDLWAGGARVLHRPDLHGMRGTGTAHIDLTGLAAAEANLVGVPGDYMRQPEISLGAWRTLAVLSGGLTALVDALRTELLDRGRTDSPHQRARFATCLVAEETARLWVFRAARLAEGDDGEAAAAYVKLARHAVDSACSTAIQLVQRSAGLAAFMRPHRIERLCRDLATYLRQPAMDMVLDEAAGHYLAGEPAP